ncbi:protein phosphatase 1 regulatory subunit 15 [Choristoneura fumiferana]|uniref:protein phosphatase 1 regulatory subunit 15 n=1 Tax=Choristoneura fumiferana TaxID=7141 RepID=UPI003D15380B
MFNSNQWRNRRNSSPMPPFGTMQYSMLHPSNYSTDATAVKSEMTKTFGDEMLIHNCHNLNMMSNPLQKNLADTIVTAEQPKVDIHAFKETKMVKEPTHTRSDFYPSLTGISSFFSGVFSALSGGMFQRRARSPAPQYYDCFDPADESPPLGWQAAKREDLNKSARAGEQSPAGEAAAMSDCGAAVVQCEDKLNRIRLLLATKPTTTTPKFRRRPRKAFVEPGSVEESFEDAFSPEDFVRLANEPYVECFSPYNHHKEELIEVEAPMIKTERVLVKIDLQTNKETDEVDAKLETKDRDTSVAETKGDPKAEVIAACEDKVNKLKELLQCRKPRRSRIEDKSADSVAEPVVDKEDERASNRTKCLRIDKPQEKHSKKPRGSDKRKKSNILKNIRDDMTFAQEIDSDDVSSPDNSPLVKPTKLCDMINICPRVTEVKPKIPEPEHKPDEYFDEVSGRFRSTSTTDSEDSFQIVFTDSSKANRARKVSDCDSEDSFIVFEDSPDSCYTSHDVFGDQSESEVTDDDSDTESDVSDSGCGVSCKLSGSFSRTVGDLTDDSLFDDTVREASDSEDEVDSAVRTMCEEIPEQDVEAEVAPKSTGLLIDEAKKLLRRQQPPKKVRFSDKPPTVRVMRVWAFAARAARAGNWHQHALDRDRFRRKIADVDMAVSWVLKPQHRSRVMFQRFMPWWNAQRRKEIAEKKQREEERKEMERIEQEKEVARVEEDRKGKEIEDKNQVEPENVGGGKDVEVIKAPVECNGNVNTELKNGIDESVMSLAKCDFYDRTKAIKAVNKDSIEMPQAVDT